MPIPKECEILLRDQVFPRLPNVQILTGRPSDSRLTPKNQTKLAKASANCRQTMKRKY